LSTREVTVRLFAGLREAIGSEEVAVWCEPEVTAADLIELLAEEFPDAADRIRASRVAADREFATADAPLPEDAEVALIPPVSGG
jgi:molybdopterin converting factor subunit 1